MPVLTGRLSGATAPNGIAVTLPQGVGLVLQGPRLQVTVGIAQAVAEELQKAGQPVPEPVSGQALIDTGATTTCIDDEAAREMHLPVVGHATLASATHESIEKNIYPVHLQVIGTTMAFAVNEAVGVDLKAQGLLALIGRDVLFRAILVYNGPDDSYTLAI